MAEVEAKLAELGYELPPPPAPVGNYLPVARSGNIMWLAGVGSRMANGEHISGKLGVDLTVEQDTKARAGPPEPAGPYEGGVGRLGPRDPHPESCRNGQQRSNLYPAGSGGGRCLRPVRRHLRRTRTPRPICPRNGRAPRGHRRNLRLCHRSGRWLAKSQARWS